MMNHVVATMGTLLGILENINTTMGTRNNLSNLIIRIGGLGVLGVLPPGLLIRIVMPAILGQNHNNSLSGLRQETSAIPGVQASEITGH
jgi:hypothetical protein